MSAGQRSECGRLVPAPPPPRKREEVSERQEQPRVRRGIDHQVDDGRKSRPF